MPQSHPEQHGTFHVTTNGRGRSPWCTLSGIPEILIDNLRMTANLQEAELLAFCILPDHVHVILRPGEKGLSTFVHSFKRNSAKDVRYVLIGEYGDARSRAHRIAAAVTNPINRSGDSAIAAIPGTSDVAFTGWQKGYHDELIRDDRQLGAAYVYVTENAVKHGLVESAEEWEWTSTSISFKDLPSPPFDEF